MLCIIPTLSAAAVLVVVCLRREKRIGGEFDGVKELAGIIRCLIAGAVLCGNAEIIRRNQHLHIADHLQNTEQTDCCQNHLAAVMPAVQCAVSAAHMG